MNPEKAIDKSATQAARDAMKIIEAMKNRK